MTAQPKQQTWENKSQEPSNQNQPNKTVQDDVKNKNQQEKK